MRADVYRSFEDLASDWPRIREDWNALVDRAPDATVFQTYEWLHNWWKSFSLSRELIIVRIGAGDRLVAVGAFSITPQTQFFRTERVLAFLGTENRASDYAGLVVDPEYSAAADLVFDTLDSLPPSDWTVFDAVNLRSESDLTARIREYSERSPLHVERTVMYDAPRCALSSPKVGEKILRKKSLRRHTKYFEKAGELEFRHIETPESILLELETLYEQHIARRKLAKDRSLFLEPEQRAFYRNLAIDPEFSKYLRFDGVYLDSKPIALHFGFEYRDTLYWYKPSFDVRWAKHSPGEVLVRFLFEYCLDRGLATLDFTVGSEPFKYRFSNEVSEIVRIKLFRNRQAYRASLFERFVRRTGKRILQRSPSRPSDSGCATGARVTLSGSPMQHSENVSRVRHGSPSEEQWRCSSAGVDAISWPWKLGEA